MSGVELGATLLTHIEVGLGFAALITFESIQSKESNEVAEAVTGDQDPTSANTTESFLIPLRIRLFTVPSGAPRRLATST